MSKNNQNKLIPTLRFPEFNNDGEWEEKALNKLGKLVNGLTYSPDDVKEEGLLVLRSSNIQNGVIVLDDNVYVRTDVKGANLSEPNDILICVRNGSKALIGKNALIPKDMPLCTHGAFMTVFRADHPKFIFQLFQTKAYATKVAGDLGATINSINGSNFLKYEFLVPKNPDEQDRIAAFLSSLDEVIIAERQKLDILKDHKKGLLQNLLPQEDETVPKFRFKEFDESGEWVEKELGSFCNSLSSGKDKNVEDGEYELYGSTGIIGRAENASYEGDFILVARVGANAGLLNKVTGKFGVTDNTLVIDLVKKDIINFIYYSLENVGLKELVFGSGQPLITGGQLKNFLLSIPISEHEQEIIADTLSSIDDLINAQNQKLESLQLHKKGLLQGLFPKLNEETA